MEFIENLGFYYETMAPPSKFTYFYSIKQIEYVA